MSSSELNCYLCLAPLSSLAKLGSPVNSNKHCENSEAELLTARFNQMISSANKDNYNGLSNECCQICGKCLDNVSLVVTQDKMVEETETRVRKLQGELLGQLRILKGQLNALQQGMQLIGAVIEDNQVIKVTKVRTKGLEEIFRYRAAVLKGKLGIKLLLE